jgi:hypothetical protein
MLVRKCVKNLVNGGDILLKYSFFCWVINSLIFIACQTLLFVSCLYNHLTISILPVQVDKVLKLFSYVATHPYIYVLVKPFVNL